MIVFFKKYFLIYSIYFSRIADLLKEIRTQQKLKNPFGCKSSPTNKAWSKLIFIIINYKIIVNYIRRKYVR